MSFVNVLPEYVAAAASDLARIGSLVGTANAQAAGATTSVLAAGGDEVSEAIAELFGAHAVEYQSISTRMAAFHDDFVQTMRAGVASYAAAEVGNAAPLQAVEQAALQLINAPTQSWFGASVDRQRCRWSCRHRASRRGRRHFVGQWRQWRLGRHRPDRRRWWGGGIIR